jgi:hypothetical protein
MCMFDNQMCESPCVNVIATPFKDEAKGIPSYIEIKNPSFDTS